MIKSSRDPASAPHNAALNSDTIKSVHHWGGRKLSLMMQLAKHRALAQNEIMISGQSLVFLSITTFAA
jgi:hypothetical protein